MAVEHTFNIFRKKIVPSKGSRSKSWPYQHKGHDFTSFLKTCLIWPHHCICSYLGNHCQVISTSKNKLKVKVMTLLVILVDEWDAVFSECLVDHFLVFSGAILYMIYYIYVKIAIFPVYMFWIFKLFLDMRPWAYLYEV